LGLLIAPSFSDRAVIRARARDAAHDDRGWAVPLDCDDLASLFYARSQGQRALTVAMIEVFNSIFS